MKAKKRNNIKAKDKWLKFVGVFEDDPIFAEVRAFIEKQRKLERRQTAKLRRGK